MAARRLSFREVARDLNSPHVRRELRTDWSMVLLYRAPGVAAAWLCLRAGMGPIGATLLGFALALSMPAQAGWLPLGLAVWTVALTGALFQVLDCADGTMARLTGRVSVRGADLDFLTGMAQWILLYVAIGLLADRTMGGGWGWTALAGIGAAARMLARLVRDQVGARVPPSAPGPVTARQSPAVLLAGVSGLIPFLALTGPWLGWAVMFLLIYGLLDCAEGALPLLRRGYG